MKRVDDLTRGALFGALAGLVGGVVFGAAMAELGVLPSVASIVRVESSVVGFVVNMAIAAAVGSGLGALTWRQRPGAGETLFWGMAYGMLWWFIGTLTLHPLILDGGPTWDVESAQVALPALLGHILYGSTAGLVIVVLRLRDRAEMVDGWSLVRGLLAGIAAAAIAGAILDAQGQLPGFVGRATADSTTTVWLLTLLIGLLSGGAFALLHPHPSDGSGPGLIRGAMYGFLWWVAASVTVLPALHGTGLPWAVAEVQEAFPSMPGYVLMGGAISLFYRWLGTVMRVLFSDVVVGGDEEGIGTLGLHTLSRGVVAGFVGGLMFTGIMVQTGVLTNVAGLARITSPVAGFFVHLLIANIIGASYGLLFRRQSYDVGSALGWGLSYGFIWWILGPLTLAPVFLGTTPEWTAAVAAEAFPNLIGHLVYGSGLGLMFYFMEARYSPWWIPRRQAEVDRVERRRQQVLTSAPALWTLVVMISLTLPLLLGLEASPKPSVPVY